MKEAIFSANHRYFAKVDLLLKELESLDEGVLNRMPSNGGWSAIQTLHHLILVEESSLAYVRKKLSFNPTFEKAGIDAWWRSLLLWLSMYFPVKFKAPAVTGDENLPAYATLAETESRWQKSRQNWQIFFEEMPSTLQDKAVYKHPRAGRLSWIQMLNFFANHLERHTRQIRKAVS